HDLRAPLRHIDGFAELLMRHAAPMLDDMGRGHLVKISAAAKRMGALIDDLLVFSRMGRTELRKTPVNLTDLTNEVIEELKSDVGDRHVEWKLGAIPTVKGDPNMLRLVMTNLLSNALKYSSPTKEARIE